VDRAEARKLVRNADRAASIVCYNGGGGVCVGKIIICAEGC